MAAVSDITVLGLDNVLLDVGDLEVAKGFYGGRLGLGGEFGFPDGGGGGVRRGDGGGGPGAAPRARRGRRRGCGWRCRTPGRPARPWPTPGWPCSASPASCAPAGWSRSPTPGATWGASTRARVP